MVLFNPSMLGNEEMFSTPLDDENTQIGRGQRSGGIKSNHIPRSIIGSILSRCTLFWMKQIADQKFITYPCDLVEEGKFWLFDAIVFPIKFPIVTFLNWIPLRMRKNFKVVSDWFP